MSNEKQNRLNHLLMDAIYKNNFTEVESLVNAGADVQYSENDPLKAAISEDNAEIAHLLMSKGAKMNNPLLTALYGSKHNITKYLLTYHLEKGDIIECLETLCSINHVKSIKEMVKLNLVDLNQIQEKVISNTLVYFWLIEEKEKEIKANKENLEQLLTQNEIKEIKKTKI